MRRGSLLVAAVVLLTFAPVCFAQSVGQDVDDLALTSLDATTTRLRWTAVESVECKQAVTYSVFRGTSEDFTPSSTNRIASGLTKATLSRQGTYGWQGLLFRQSRDNSGCVLPHSGTMRVYPLDLGQHHGRGWRGSNWDLYCASHVGNPMRQPTSGFPCSDRRDGDTRVSYRLPIC